MSAVAVRAENLSKLYRIGQRERYYTLRDTLARSLIVPFRHLRRIAKGEGRNGGSDNPQFAIRNSQSYDPQSELIWALKDVSFEIKRGDVIGIIGRNGAGKTTLLKILSRITEPTEGCAEIHGRVGSLLEVGTGFHPELTGRENIYLNGAILGMKRREIERKFDKIVAFAEVEKFIDTPVKHYSSGMYVRLAFAVAAHLEPEILLVDEVLAVGDAAFQKKCLGKMGEVAAEGRTVLFVSHNMGAIGSLCNKTVYLETGQIRKMGATEAVVTDYVAELFDNRTEDLRRLRLEGYGNEVRFNEIRLVCNDKGNLTFGQPIQYLLTVESDVDLKDLSVGSSLFTSSGICLGTLFTKEKFAVEAHRQLRLRLTVAGLNLAPGAYYAGFSVGRGGRESVRTDFDIVVGRPVFQVLPLSQDGDPIAHWSPSWGNLVIQDAQLMIDEA